MVRRSLEMRGDDIPHMFGLFRRTPDDPVPFYDARLWAFDTDACLRALCRGGFGFVHRRLYDYRDHPGQATHTVLRGSTSKLLDPLRLVAATARVLDPGHCVASGAHVGRRPHPSPPCARRPRLRRPAGGRHDDAGRPGRQFAAAALSGQCSGALGRAAATPVRPS
jgi:hypothetical protein